MCEYEHAMVTAREIYGPIGPRFIQNPICRAVCIWDWVDQGLRQPQKHEPHGGFKTVHPGEKRFGLMVEISVLKEFQATIISAATVWSQPIVWDTRPPASQTCLSIHPLQASRPRSSNDRSEKLVRFRESQGRCRGHMASKG